MAAGGVTLFALGEHLDWLSLTLCMIGLIVFTIVFEVFLHNLEHRIRVRGCYVHHTGRPSHACRPLLWCWCRAHRAVPR